MHFIVGVCWLYPFRVFKLTWKLVGLFGATIFVKAWSFEADHWWGVGLL